MGKRGPKPKTARTAPRVASCLDGWDVPGHLSEEAGVAWRHVVALLAAAGNLGRTDPSLVECYAVNVALLRSAQAVLDLDGPLVMNKGKYSSHPANTLVNSASMRIKTIVESLGLCPSSSKFASSTPTDARTQDSEWADLLGATG